jgi:GntR family transcriptional regulator/MocR family aminotransferase
MPSFGKTPFIPTADSPLYQQLYTHMRTAILRGELKGGTKLPSTRALADEFNISRNTVVNAYRQLTAEGYLEGVEGSGSFVVHVLPDDLLTPFEAQSTINTEPPGSNKPVFSKHATSQLAEAPTSVNIILRPFSSELPALDVFPAEIWSRLIVRHAHDTSIHNLKYQESAGYYPLREAIAAHVAISRQVHCSPEQIVIVSGSQGGLDLSTRMLVNAGEPVWLEDPGYVGARGAFLGVGAKIVPVPVDKEGLIVKEGVKRAPKARLVYITPSHQFPLGYTMSLARRLELLDWAKRANAYILEDDYDSEYRYANRPLAALKGLDTGGRVIYIGTFSKVMFPSLRIGYLILPEPLVDPFLKVRRLMNFHNPILEQMALTDFITEGHFARHLRRMRSLYSERRGILLEALRKLPLEVESPEAGLHCIGWLPKGIKAETVIRDAPAHDLDLSPVSAFCIEPFHRQGILLGYAAFSASELRSGVRRLKELLLSL